MTAEDLRKSILQQAIQGKLVPQDPNDEPASELLSKIRAEKERLIKEKKIKRDKNETIIYRGEDNSYYEKILATGEVKCIDDEIPFEIPDSWEWSRIRNISQSYIGLTYSPSDVSDDGVIVLRSSNIKNGKIDLADLVRVNKVIPDKLNVVVNDIIICARNGSAKLVGKSALVREVEEPMTFGAFMAICKTPLYEYVYTFLQSDLFFSQLREVSSTTTINQLTQNNFNNFLITIPPVKEQIRLVTKVNKLIPIIDDYAQKYELFSDLNKSINTNLRKAILQEAIQGHLVPQLAEEDTAQDLLKTIKEEKQQLVKEGRLKKSVLSDSVIFRGDDNKYWEKKDNELTCIDDEIPFDIPDSWKWVRFSTIANFSLGKTPERANKAFWNPEKYPWVSIADMEDKSVLTKTKEQISEKALVEKFNGTLSPVGTLIMSFKLTIGKVSILGIEATHNEAIISIFPYVNTDNIMRDYLFNIFALTTSYTASTDAIKGATLNSKKIADMLIPLPPLYEQKRIILALDKVLASIMRK